MANPTRQAINRIRNEMNTSYMERKSAIDAMLLAILSRQHIFILGPAGSAKSALVRDLVSRISGANHFETLLSKTRPDQAVLGPYDLPELRDHGNFQRKTGGYLPEADFAFLVVAGKMSPTLGHDMLAILNERIYHEVGSTGRSARAVPLRTAFCASNELLTVGSEDAVALWDRLMLRIVVDYVAGVDSFVSVLKGANGSQNKTTITLEELDEVVNVEVPAIKIPKDIYDTLVDLRQALITDHGIRASDRRWQQSIRIMQASAWLNNRAEVDVDDIGVLRWILWDAVEQMSTVDRATMKLVNPLTLELIKLEDSLAEIELGIVERKGKSMSERGGYGSEQLSKLKTIANEADHLRQQLLAASRSTDHASEVLTKIGVIRKRILNELLEASPEDLA